MRVGALVVLARLCEMGSVRLRILMSHHDPVDGVELLARGRDLHPMVMRGLTSEQRAKWHAVARDASLDDEAATCHRHGVQVVAFGDAEFPAQLAVDPDPPAVLFVRGDLDVLRHRRVGIVGTRNATAAGRATATELGDQLAREGVAVVSGLARGIDGAAHRGVRGAGADGIAVAVVGNGLDRPYPKQHAALWEWVAEHGLLISEWPPGTEPTGWRFPRRNRIIAALSELLVVVESRERGGSLITALAAIERGIDVLAVPGSPRSRASAGTNQLLVDGAAPVTSVADVLAVLGLDHRRAGELPFDPRPEPDDLQRRVLAVCVDEPTTLDGVVAALGIPIADAALAVARLERSGWLVEASGWFEPAGSRLGRR